MMGEITVDWVDIPPNSTIFETKEGRLLRTPAYRLVYFDAVGQQQTQIDMDEEGGEEKDPYGELTHKVDPYPTNPWGDSDQHFVGRKHGDWDPPQQYPRHMPMKDIIEMRHQGRPEWGDQVRNPLYTRSVRSVIQGDEQYEDCEPFREAILEKFRASVFQSKKYGDVTPQMLEKRGDYGTVKLTLKKGAQPKSCKAVRAVGIREKI